MSKKLLLADDSITIQKVIGITFAHEGYALTIVDNGDAALEKARDLRPDLILADVFMPGKNGYELCGAVKGDPDLGNIPVLLLTGTFEPFDENKAIAAGADSWIAKPFESQALIDRVEELLTKAPEPAAAVDSSPADFSEETFESPEAEPDSAFEFEDPLVEADLWEELGDLGEEAPAVDFEPVHEPEGPAESWDEPASGASPESDEPAEEDIWGPVSFGEDELGPEPAMEVEGAEEDVWGGVDFEFGEDEPVPEEDPGVEFEEEALSPAFVDEEDETFLFEEESPAGESLPSEPSGEEAATGETAPQAEPEESFIFEEEVLDEEDAAWEEADEEILPLDEDDILEAEDLEPLEEVEEFSYPAPSENRIDSDLEAPSSVEEELPVEEEPEVGEEQEPVHEEDFSLVEEGPEWGLSEETSVEVFEPAEEEEEEEAAAEPAVPPVAPESGVPKAAAETVEAQVHRLSDEELSRVAESVAGAVIEKLAGSILEKIAWEVVPDLAENLIREEIRKIKAGVR
jgi:CheY-like chemotaxis protein